MTQSPAQKIVLMYHGIVAVSSDVPQEREAGADLYDVSGIRFAEQMDWLKQSGAGAVLTFDDGEMNNFTRALPVLTQQGLSAYFFIIAKRVGKPGYMGWPEIRNLRENGMIVGSHGLSHEILTTLSPTQMEEELSASKKSLEANLGATVTALSIPRGFCNNDIIRCAQRLGYREIFISDRPAGLTVECLERVAVKSNWDLRRFAMAVHGKKPFSERCFDATKNLAKTVLPGRAYDAVRSFLTRP